MKKILVRAPFLTQSGYGEHGRFVLRALRAYEEFFDIYALPINWGNTGWLWEDTEERRWFDDIIAKTVAYNANSPFYDVSVQVTIPNEWQKMAPVNVGVTAGIETTKVAHQWIEKSLLMDRIVTPSSFAADIFKNTKCSVTNNQTGETDNSFITPTPFEVVHYPYKKSLKESKISLDLEYDFNFLTVAQWGPRKNINNLITWFVEEFSDQEVGLICKLQVHKNCYMDRGVTHSQLKNILAKFPDRKCKVYLLHGHLKDEEMLSLYKNKKIKAFVTTTHGEGFGLPLFDAVCNDMPVVAPDWSGHLDFLYMPVKNKKGKLKNKAMYAKVDYVLAPVPKEVVWDEVLIADSQWCVPEQGSFKRKMREVNKDYTRFKSDAKKLGKYIRKNFSEDKKYKQMAEAIHGEALEKLDTAKIPKISIITSVFNGDEYIESFMEDIVNQTLFKEKCELILINANSPGNEEEVINTYLEKYPDNIVYKRLDEDPGIYAVWNMAVSLASGEYLTNANLDDRHAPWAFERQATTLVKNPNADLVYADMLITEQPNETWEKNTSNGKKYNFPDFSYDNLKMINMPHAAPMWKKSMHDKYGKFNEKYGSAGDWEMWLRAAQQGSVFVKMSAPVGLYYFNPTGISTNPDNFDWKRKEEKEIYEMHVKQEVAA
jgi:glycosyltransferase involved in cell wall biosynthesis